jgi:phosphoglycolate phosphatase
VTDRLSVRLMVFDLDGTLVDSSQDLADAGNALLGSYGADALEAGTVVGMVGDGARELVRRLLAARGIDTSLDEAFVRFMGLYGDRLLESTTPYDGIVDVLTELQQRGTDLAVLTNKPEGFTRRLLDGLGLARFFPLVIGGDGPLPRKPEPAGLIELMSRRRAAAAQTVMVGDSANDVRAATAAGVGCCLVRYGFGFGQVEPAIRASAAWVIDAPRQLLGIDPGLRRS